jgi:hypothetical protein
MSDVTTPHPDYKRSQSLWERIEDACAGEEAVKSKGEKYLPKPNPRDRSVENQYRYEQYVARAVYYNATGRTLRALTGLAFGDEPELTLPSALNLVSTDVDGANAPLAHQAKSALAEVLKSGRSGLLVDYPAVDHETSRADQLSGDIRPTVTLYRALDIVNWRTRRVGARTVLSFLVLKECVEDPDDEDQFQTVEQTQYRVLKLDPNYQVEIWQQVEQDTAGGKVLQWEIVESYAPLQGDGRPWTEIPFQFLGAEENTWIVGDSPLADIATLNIAHFRNSADYEDSVYLVGQPTVWFSGLTEEWRDHMEDKGVYIGSRSPIALPINGSAGILQAQPNSLAKEAMDAKETQMAALGAKLIQQYRATRTATEILSDDAVAHSVLTAACANVSMGYLTALKWFAVFQNVPETTGIVFRIKTDFTESQVDAPMLQTLLQLVQAGKMPESDLFAQLRRVGLIAPTKTDDQIREEIEAEPPMPDLGAGAPPGGKAGPEAPEEPAGGGAEGGAAGGQRVAVRAHQRGAAGS